MPPPIGESDIAPDGDYDAAGDAENDATSIEVSKRTTGSSWFKWLRRLVLAAFIVIGGAAGGIYLLLQMAKVEPDFYRAALQVDPQIQKKNGSEMETRILDLRNSVLIADAWSASFSETQINGWLAWDLQKKFPKLIPREVTDPQLVIEDQSVTIAFHCTAKPFRGVAIIEADIFLTGILNQLGIRIKSIRSGMIPVPIAAFANQITAQAKKSGFDIQWKNEGSDTVAIIDLPDAMIKPNDGGSYIELETLEIVKGRISIGGVTHPPDF